MENRLKEVIVALAKRRSISSLAAVVFTFLDVNFSLWRVDIFLREDHSYRELRKDAVMASINERRVAVVSKRKLVDLKRRIVPPRARDTIDIAELTRLMEEES